MSKKTEGYNTAEYIESHWPFVAKEIELSLKLLPEIGKETATHILGTRGKRLRPTLLLLSGGAFKIDSKLIYPLAAALELVHTASLLHDDIEDGSTFRRGKPTAHEVFGAKGALLAGDSFLALALCICSRNYSVDICKCLADALLETVSGQIKELAKKDDLSDYFESILLKTGSLLGCACEMGARLAGKDEETCLALQEFGKNLGVAYQIADDWQDFLPVALTGKDQCRDLLKGNVTLPIHLSFKTLSLPKQSMLIDKICTGSLSAEMQTEICEIALSPEIQNQVNEHIEYYLKDTWKGLEFFPDSPEKNILRLLVKQISQSVRGRKCLQD